MHPLYLKKEYLQLNFVVQTQVYEVLREPSFVKWAQFVN